MAEQDLTLRFKVQDDGSVVLDKFSTKLAQIPQHVNTMNTSLSLIKWSSLVNLGEQAYQTGQQIYEMAKQTAASINDIDRAAKVANMTTTQYQLMAYAAKMSDVSIEELSVGMKRLSVNMDAAQKVGGPAADSFDRIGISVKDANGKMKSLNDIMLEIADKFSTWEDGPRKIAIAVDLFGKSGERLIPYLNQGAAGIKKFYEEAEKMGIVLDESMIKKGTELEDRFKRAEAAWDSFKKKLVVGVYEAITSTRTWVEAQEQLNAALASAGGLVTEEMTAAIEMQKVNEAAEQGAAIFEKLNAAALKQAVQPPAIVDKEKDLKIYREVNLQLLKDQESTLKRIIDLQDKLNKSSEDAIKIMEQLGIGTKAALTQWINEDIVGQYGKLLGSKLFNPEEMEAAKAKYIEALQAAETTGGWGGEFRQIEEAISKISTMKVDDTEIQKTRNELADLQRYMEYLNSFTSTIKLNDDQLVTAQNQVLELRRQLMELTSRRWDLNIAITGSGSSEMPIMDKIQEVYNAFTSMGADVGQMTLNMNLEQITAAINQAQTDIREAYSPPAQRYGSAYTFGVSYFGAKDLETIRNAQANIKALEQYRTQIQTAAGAGLAAITPAAGGGGGGYGGGGVQILINTINVTAGMEGVAAELDDQLADLWYKNRSKLKVAIQG